MGIRRGFTLPETMIALLVMAVVSTAVYVVTSGYEDGNSIVRREADNAAFWFTDRMSRAQIEQCDLKISMSECSAKNAEIVVTWRGGTLDGRKERYRSSEARLFPVTGDLSRTHVYNGEWNTLTPALTINVKPMPPKKAGNMYIVMSPLGHVTVRESIN